MARISRSQQRSLIRNVERIMKRAASRPMVTRRLAKALGPFGSLASLMADLLAGGSNTRRALELAIGILTEAGFEVGPTGPPGGPLEPPIQAPPRGGRRPPPGRTPPPGSTPPRGREEPEGYDDVRILPTRIRGAIEDSTGWIRTPHSSCVHAVAFDAEEGIMYVCYRAADEPIGYKPGKSICSGERYQIGFRPDVPGPVYSYGGRRKPVPRSIFDAIAMSKSPGREIWDKLRVCGSRHEHQYVYTLTSLPDGQRVPRRSTRRGYRTRNLANVGMGRRGYRSSLRGRRLRGM